MSRKWKQSTNQSTNQNQADNYSMKPADRDPERDWKSKPDRWAAWEEASSRFTKQTYVNEPDWSRFSDPRKRSVWLKELGWKTLCAALLFAAIWGLFQYDNSWTKRGQAFVKQALTDEIDFVAAADWYKQTFAGSPTLLPIFGQKPQNAVGVDAEVKTAVVAPLEQGDLVRTFAELLNGIELAAPSASPVMAIETGRVILVSEDQASIMIQHANRRVSIYTGLGADVKVNDWVEAGDQIGTLLKSNTGSHSLLYFAIKDNDRYVDPLDVIPFD